MFSSISTSFCNSLSTAYVTAGVVTAGVVTAGVVMAGAISLPKGGVSTLPNGGDSTGLVACTELSGGAILGAWIVAPAANEVAVGEVTVFVHGEEIAFVHAAAASTFASFVNAEAM
jgi:hypothetical protein